MKKGDNRYKLILIEMAGLICITFLICGVLYMDVSKVEVFTMPTQESLENVNFSLDHINNTEKYLTIRGWAYINEKNIEYFDTSIVLKECNSDKYFRIPTSYEERRDVTEAYGKQELNYDHSGFFANVQKKKLPSGCFEIYIELNTHTDPGLFTTNQYVKL